MKLLIAEILSLFTKRQERNVKVLIKFLFALMTMVTVYTVGFHFVMLGEGREFSWITGFYWTLTVMSTLGFGDITFTSDLGKLFSILVLMSGIIFLLTMLPFIFIRFLYLPWLESQTKARTPRELPKGTHSHVILTRYDPITINLIERLKRYDYGYVIIIQDAQVALELHDLDHKVVAGDLGDPETYRRIRTETAALVFANVDDMTNTNIAFTVREISQDIPIVANADLDDSVDVLQLAGCTHVFQFMKMLGRSLARRVLGRSTGANVIGSFGTLLIAEASAMRTPLEGLILEEAGLRERLGITVVGIWERGKFRLPDAQTMITPETVLVLAGSAEQLASYDKLFRHYPQHRAPVLILGGGRVGCASAQSLYNRNIDYRIIEKDPELIGDENYVQGSAGDIKVLKRAGIDEAPSVLITTSDDATNIYLTIYCRRLRPDIQIISRANFETNISKLHTAGADLVMSYASMAASMIVNLIKPGELVMLTEGLNVFRAHPHSSLVGKSLSESHIRGATGCNVIAIQDADEMIINPDPSFRFAKDNELIMIGTTEGEKQFFETYSEVNKLK
ncbi:potassium channel family protein [Thermodesulfobacteriota bacterium]